MSLVIPFPVLDAARAALGAPPPATPFSGAAIPTPSGELFSILASRTLNIVFQPIVSAQTGEIFAHEALVRGPAGSLLESADALFKAARELGLLYELELECARLAVQRWGELGERGRLFVNISADVLVQAVRHSGDALQSEIIRAGLLPRMLVLELTEHERVSDMAGLRDAARAVHTAGISLALDDFGDGRSSLRLWSELQPEFVKIDKYFTSELSRHAQKLLTFRALLQIAETFGTSLVAEGIECAADARVIRDLGIAYCQGYFVGRPQRDVRRLIDAEARDVFTDTRVSVFPEPRRHAPLAQLRGISVISAPAVHESSSNDHVASTFLDNPDLHALAVTVDGLPRAIINRTSFLNHYARSYFKELHGRKSCMMLANTAPRLVERAHDIDELVGILTSQDQRYLADGFIVTDNGRYVGLGTGDQLVRTVTEARIEAARHANPLTLLPGNIPITQHLERLLRRGASFVACYADMNHFKPFNDLYGYWRGDEMIRLAAQLALAHADPEQDFVGHVGGDDFIWVFQSDDWQARVHRILDAFAPRAEALFDTHHRAQGGIEAEDRHGVVRFFPCTTLSVGAVAVSAGAYHSAEQVANAAAVAKQEAKRRQAPLSFVPASA